MAITTMIIAPLLARACWLPKDERDLLQPILAVVLVGRYQTVPPMAAKVGSAAAADCGGLLRAAVNKLPMVMHEFHFVAAVFVLLVAVMLVIGKLRPRATDWVQEDSGDVDLTPWKGAVPTGIVLVVLVVIMYASFAGG